MQKTDFLTNLLLLLATIIILIVLTEFFFRVFMPQITLGDREKKAIRIYQESEFISFELKPNTKERQTDLLFGEKFDVTLSINSLGYRDNEFAISKLNNTKRILIMGDSFTFGHGVENDETFSEQLEKKINEFSNIKYEVINAGYASGQSPDEAYVYLKKKGLQLNPDIIILVVFPGNDISDINEHEWIIDKGGLPLAIKDKYDYVENNQLRSRQKSEIRFTSRLNALLARYSHFYNYLKRRISYIFQKVHYNLEGTENKCIYCDEYWIKNKDEWNQIKKILINVKKISEENNIKFYLAIIPMREQVYDSYWDSYLNEVKSDDIDRNKIQQEFINFSEKNNIPLIDFLPSFLENNLNMYYFSKDLHWNKEGHELASQIILEKLINDNLIPIPKENIEVNYAAK